MTLDKNVTVIFLKFPGFSRPKVTQADSILPKNASDIKNEGLLGVLRNKGTWPISTGEQGNKGKISKGTREQKAF